MKKAYFLLIFVFAGLASNAQQLQSTSFYELQGLMHNPSIAGVSGDNMLAATYRSQWSGMSGSPVTANLFGSFCLDKRGIGVGGYVYSDKTGPISRTGIDLSLAKHVKMRNGALLSLGLETRLQQYAIDMVKLTESLGPSDPVLSNGDSKFKYDAGFGVSYTTADYQIGASVSQLVQSKLDFYSGTLTRSAEARLYRHYYLHGYYRWEVDDANVIIPHALLIYLPNAPLEFQGGFRLEHKNLFWWGLSLRARQSWLLSAGLHLTPRLNLGYSFEIYRTPLSEFNGGAYAHDFMLRYDLKK